MRPYLPLLLRIALFIFLLISSAAVLYSTAQNTGLARSLMKRAGLEVKRPKRFKRTLGLRREGTESPEGRC